MARNVRDRVTKLPCLQCVVGMPTMQATSWPRRGQVMYKIVKSYFVNFWGHSTNHKFQGSPSNSYWVYTTNRYFNPVIAAVLFRRRKIWWLTLAAGVHPLCHLGTSSAVPLSTPPTALSSMSSSYQTVSRWSTYCRQHLVHPRRRCPPPRRRRLRQRPCLFGRPRR